ncbi:MAG TPA: DUF58 domain-containing protein, partial [Planctomycetota bacterium]|nr:DUF58 domain-containing protein [Planctomycetota bacterium]
GLHRSPFRGFSVEFAEYRQYAPGDDIRHIDWKVYGKNDRFYVKQYEEETNLSCWVLLDCSASMGYGSGNLTKLQYGSYLAASLAYFMIHQRDATGLVLFDEKVRMMLPPRSRQTHLHHMLAALEDQKPGEGTNIAAPLHEMAEGLKRRGLMVLISDLYDDPERVLSALQHFKFQGSDLIVFQIADAAELKFPFERMTEFVDPESGESVTITGDAVRKAYFHEMEKFFGRYRKGCADLKVDYHVFDTSTPLELALSEYLFLRSRSY